MDVLLVIPHNWNFSQTATIDFQIITEKLEFVDKIGANGENLCDRQVWDRYERLR